MVVTITLLQLLQCYTVAAYASSFLSNTSHHYHINNLIVIYMRAGNPAVLGSA